VLGRLVGQLADHDAVDRSRTLNPRRRVHHVSCGLPDLLAGIRADDDDRVTRIDACADVEVEPVVARVQPLNRLRDGERSANRPLRVVLVRDRRAEQGNDSVTDELRNRSAVELELAARLCVVGDKPRAHVFGIELLRRRRRADDVCEHCGDEAPLFRPRLDRRGCGCPRHRRAARKAELRDIRVFLAATDAERHVSSLGSAAALDEGKSPLRHAQCRLATAVQSRRLATR
jgi:hypothetical protein